MEPIIYNLGNGFQQILNPDGTIQIVPIEETNNLPFNVGGQLFNQFEDTIPNQTTFDPRSLQSIFPPRGITASSAAIPFKEDPIAIAQGFVEGSPSDISFSPRGIDTSFGVANEEDVEQEFLPNKKSGIAKLFDFLQKFSPINIVRGLLPEQDPRAINIRNFYGSQFGLTPSGQVASGIMKGYNPISGGFINKLTGGKFGNPTKYGLQDAYQKRIDRIKKTLQEKYINQGRSLDETELDERLAELEQLKLDELNAFRAFMDSKAPQPKGLEDIGTGGAGTAPTTTTTTTGGGDDKPSPMQIKASKSPKVGVAGYTKKDDVRESRRGRYF